MNSFHIYTTDASAHTSPYEVTQSRNSVSNMSDTTSCKQIAWNYPDMCVFQPKAPTLLLMSLWPIHVRWAISVPLGPFVILLLQYLCLREVTLNKVYHKSYISHKTNDHDLSLLNLSFQWIMSNYRSHCPNRGAAGRWGWRELRQSGDKISGRMGSGVWWQMGHTGCQCGV